MIDWTHLTRNPVDTEVRGQIRNWLLSIRSNIPRNDYDAFLVEQVRGRSVLDIGVCEHTVDRINSSSWKHRLIQQHASRCVGVDIIEDLVQELVRSGYDVRCQDATSDTFLGETFDIVHVGDVIEHVDNPQRLLEFCARHLSPGGKILVRTPNPHNFDYQRSARIEGISIENLEHVCYVTPFHAVELARRARVSLDGYWTMSPGRLSVEGIRRFLRYSLAMRFRHAWEELFGEPNTYTTIFVFVFGGSDTRNV